MAELDAKISELEQRLESLVRTQIDFQTEISNIRRELTKLRGSSAPERRHDLNTNKLPPPPIAEKPQPQPPEPEIPKAQYEPPRSRETQAPNFGYTRSAASEPETVTFSSFVDEYFGSARGNLEKFIGENLISKIGILILLLGVGIGAKFAIDNGWISPVMRVAAGYLLGVALIGVALKLKAKYHNFSAVVMSGGLATVYLITFFAYSYYALIPMMVAFVVMVLITIATVGLAVVYDRQVIAHFGLVGAYTLPFLLSNNSGNYLALFSYMSIVNVGILAVSIRKYWLPIFFTSFIVTWLIYFAWIADRFKAGEHLTLALVFLGIFFAIFYVTKLIQKVVFKETDEILDKVMLVVTVVVFYSLCFIISISLSSSFEFISLFAYIASISAVVLVTSYRFYDRIIVYIVNPAVWGIFWVWFVGSFNSEADLVMGSTFAGIYFVLFYGAAIYYRLVDDQISSGETSGLVISNSLVFYGFGYAMMDSRVALQPLDGLFTAGHAALHSFVAQLISRFRASRVDLVQALAVLIITFATAAIPVQFDGRVVTLIWSIEAAALFWFGRVRVVRLFESFSYPIMVLAFTSLWQDWVTIYDAKQAIAAGSELLPLMNGYFVSTLVFVVAFAFIWRVDRDNNDDTVLTEEMLGPFCIAVGAITLFVLYNAFRIEIGNYYYWRMNANGVVEQGLGSSPTAVGNRELSLFNILWQINYTLLFVSVLTFVNLKRVRSTLLAHVGTIFSVGVLSVFTTVGLFVLYQLRVSYITYTGIEGDPVSVLNIAIRYVCYAFAGACLYSVFAICRDELISDKVSSKVIELGYDFLLYSILFLATSTELLNVMAQMHIGDGTKLGLSIWWAIFAIAMIIAGIAWQKQHLRFAAITLLAVTLVKLFIYDVANLETIPKTILFVTLGLLLLVVSFLYNKYRTRLFADESEGESKVNL